MLAIILSIFLFTLFCFWNFVWKRRGYPPGPIPLPIVGNTLALIGNQYLPLLRWTKQYGPIYTIWMGEDPTVMVNEYGLMRDLFVKEGDAYAGRDLMTSLYTNLDATKGSSGGVFFIDGDVWRVMRRFSIQALRNLGMGKAKLEQQFIVDIGELIGRLRENELAKKGGGKGNNIWEEGVDLFKEIDLLIGSFINRIIFGYAHKESQQIDKFFAMKRLMEEHLQMAMSFRGRMITSHPILRHFPLFSAKFDEINESWTEINQKMDAKLQQKIDAREKQSPEEPKDLVDYYLEQMDLAKEGKGDQEQLKHFTKENLPILIGDLLGAGQETTSLTLNFLILYLLLDQRVQRKMQAELDGLDAEKGRNGFGDWITLADRPKLPFVNAVINETQRLCNLLPINLSHRTTCDVEIMGGKYNLKKGTTIIPQIGCLLYDENVFPNAQRFVPERFLDEDGHLKKFDELIPFGLGKRVCIGESLARTEMFLFTANFFRIFNVYPVDALNPPSVEKEFDFGARPKHFKCRLALRKKDKFEDEK